MDTLGGIDRVQFVTTKGLERPAAVLTVREVARLLHVATSTVYKLCSDHRREAVAGTAGIADRDHDECEEKKQFLTIEGFAKRAEQRSPEMNRLLGDHAAGNGFVRHLAATGTALRDPLLPFQTL